MRLSLNEPAIEENISSRLLSSIETFLDFLATGDQTLALMQQEQILYLLLRRGINPFSFQQDLATKIRNLIETDPTATWTASEVAEQRMSERTLRRHLKTANLRCSALIRISGLLVGLALLQKGSQRVGEIAYACGYESASRFSERFREHFNVLPLPRFCTAKRLKQAQEWPNRADVAIDGMLSCMTTLQSFLQLITPSCVYK